MQSVCPPLGKKILPVCPYVQRAVIALTEKQVPFERIDIDLANKPDWFLAISPLSKTPVLKVGGHAISESAVILEYLEETQSHPLHPADPLTRAEHRSWIEFGSSVLADIAGLYTAPDSEVFQAKAEALTMKFGQIEQRVSSTGPYFDGSEFSLVDAVFGPVFRYFDVFDNLGDFAAGIGVAKPRVAAWRQALFQRASIRAAVAADYPERLTAFLRARGSHLSKMMS
jgi:glutathione S-transferase